MVVGHHRPMVANLPEQTQHRRSPGLRPKRGERRLGRRSQMVEEEARNGELSCRFLPQRHARRQHFDPVGRRKQQRRRSGDRRDRFRVLLVQLPLLRHREPLHGVDVRLHGAGVPLLQRAVRPLPQQTAASALHQSVSGSARLEGKPEEDPPGSGGLQFSLALLLGDLGGDQRGYFHDPFRVLGVRGVAAEELLRAEEEVYYGFDAVGVVSSDEEEELQFGVKNDRTDRFLSNFRLV